MSTHLNYPLLVNSYQPNRPSSPRPERTISITIVSQKG